MKHGALFHIFVPLLYNNGRPIEDAKFQQTMDELINQFGGLTVDPSLLTQGFWQSRGKVFGDRIKILAVFSETFNDARAYLQSMKPAWKRRFRQDEVFIVEVCVEVL